MAHLREGDWEHAPKKLHFEASEDNFPMFSERNYYQSCEVKNSRCCNALYNFLQNNAITNCMNGLVLFLAGNLK
jgi:hypothetical protein